jgi:hypothetical protein
MGKIKDMPDGVRATDTTLFGSWYRKRIPEIHLLELVIILITGGVTWGIMIHTVSAQGDTLNRQELRLDAADGERKQINKLIQDQAVTSTRMETKLDDIIAAFNVPHKNK